MRCYSYIFPNEIVSKNYEIKELAVVDFVKENYKDYKWVYNKRVYDSMTKRIIDLYLELEDQIIIIKVDENKNINYENTPDNQKLIKMLLDAKNKPVVFIRFNPNSYKSKGKNIRPCWNVSKVTGVISINEKSNWNIRLKNLKEKIDYWLVNKCEQNLEVIELYYK